MATMSQATAALTAISLLEGRCADPLGGDTRGAFDLLLDGADPDDLRTIVESLLDSFVMHTRPRSCEVYRELDEQRRRVVAWAARTDGR